jgi:hypothetical protein
VDEGFLLGCASNTHRYRVFNNSTGLVEIVVDVTFDESNDLQGQVSNDMAGNEEPPCAAIKKLAIGEVRPQEKDEDEVKIWMTNEVANGSTRVVDDQPSIEVKPSTSSHPTQEEPIQPQRCQALMICEVVDGGAPQEQEDDGCNQHQSLVPHPRVHQSVQRDHPIDNILGSTKIVVTTHSRSTLFCKFYSIVSSLKPLKVDEARGDSNWIIAMQEELNNFTRNEV